MKGILLKVALSSLAVSSLAGTVFAQEETPAKLKLYGFVRNYTLLDSREMNGGTNDLYLYMPKDELLNEDKEDLNKGFNWKSLALTSRLGLDIKGYRIGNLSMTGKIEADFYSLNGTSSSATIAQMRLRHAYVTLAKDLSHNWKYSLTIGQTWHPIAANLPHTTNLESGAPFNPFNRSPQFNLKFMKNGWTLDGSVLYLSQYLPMDMQGMINEGAYVQAGYKSVNPYKYGFPEVYLGASYKKGPVLLSAGVSEATMKPIRTETDATGNTYKVKGDLYAPVAFVFGQYTNGSFQLRGKTTLNCGASQLNMLTGYAVYTYDELNRTYEYTPMRTLASWLSMQYGKKVQFMCMAGYMKDLGTTEDILPGSLLLNSAAATNIRQAARITPTIAWNIGKLSISLEYDLTAAQFGEGTYDERGLYSDYHWILGHRIINMVKYSF